jgi:hypothetical protein
MDKCVYGCGQKAKFTLKNEKLCCSKHHSSCPAIKRKITESNKVAHQAGVKRGSKSNKPQENKGTLVFEDIFVQEPMVASAK